LLIYTNIFHNWHNLSIARLLLSCRTGVATANAGGDGLGRMQVRRLASQAQGSYEFNHTRRCEGAPLTARAPELIDRIEQ
jgi:hypothetical protein